jgi:hypothetical protein
MSQEKLNTVIEEPREEHLTTSDVAEWGRGDNVSTEDLRVALQRYRSFFSRLLSV